MDPQLDGALMWIAREGLMAPLPQHWRACQAPGEGADIYYFNFATGTCVLCVVCCVCVCVSRRGCGLFGGGGG
jgi:hypothetical protein